jgi:aminomethyltransferase
MGKRTPFYEIHKAYHGRMVEFAGWEMPVYYTGIIEEHRNVRKNVGLFDVSHMGEIEVRGKDALINLQKLLVSNIQTLSIPQVKYSALCYPEGGVVDDITVYRLAEERFLLCVNAANTEKDYQWIAQHLEGEAEAIDQSAAYAQIALQGPRSMEVLRNLTPTCLKLLKNYWFVEGTVDGVPAIISRTGYTGEDGFELYFHPEFATQIWERLMTEGKTAGIQSVGLGARDTLRLEMGFPLYGHEFDATTTLLEAGLYRFIDFRKPFFIGKERLLQQKRDGIYRRLVGFKMAEEGIPRSQYEIYKNEEKVGMVTSGTMSPTFRKGIGLGYVKIGEAWEGNEVSIMIRQKKFPAEIVKLPFYNRFLARGSEIRKDEKHMTVLREGGALGY